VMSCTVVIMRWESVALAAGYGTTAVEGEVLEHNRR
jgi:hypothetical protein